jgi:hypothetical protein
MSCARYGQGAGISDDPKTRLFSVPGAWAPIDLPLGRTSQAGALGIPKGSAVRVNSVLGAAAFLPFAATLAM